MANKPEVYPKDTPEKRLKAEVKLKLKAGATKSWYEYNDELEKWLLYTVWD